MKGSSKRSALAETSVGANKKPAASSFAIYQDEPSIILAKENAPSIMPKSVPAPVASLKSGPAIKTAAPVPQQAPPQPRAVVSAAPVVRNAVVHATAATFEVAEEQKRPEKQGYNAGLLAAGATRTEETCFEELRVKSWHARRPKPVLQPAAAPAPLNSILRTVCFLQPTVTHAVSQSHLGLGLGVKTLDEADDDDDIMCVDCAICLWFSHIRTEAAELRARVARITLAAPRIRRTSP
jgi:hypothetical protein